MHVDVQLYNFKSNIYKETAAKCAHIKNECNCLKCLSSETVLIKLCMIFMLLTACDTQTNHVI